MLKIEVDASALLAALDRLPEEAERFTDAAALETARSIEREARRRVPIDTGRLHGSIEVRPADRGGYVVGTFLEPKVGIAGHTRKRTGRFHTQRVTQDNLPLWIEFGTQQGKPRSRAQPARPFLFNSARIEEGPHRRRLEEAVADAIDSLGLGD